MPRNSIWRHMSETKLLPPALDTVADEWRRHIEQTVQLNVTHDFSKHVEGTYSVYHMSFTFQKDEPVVVHYAGMTQNPKTRRDQHKSELKCCKSTTRTGKSKLYCDQYFDGVSQIDMHFTVIESGFTSLDHVKIAEKTLANDLATRFGKDSVLTTPRKNTESLNMSVKESTCSLQH